ncbi:MAG: hypothetical protein JRM80_14175 [Nitrososphaerota archaeon]|nr:hypothetical protein [Nitrososphaerota archaeon]
MVAVSGFNMANTPELLIVELHRRYKETGHPRRVFLLADALPAIPGRALDAVAKELFTSGDRTFLRGVSVPFLGFSPWLQKLVEADMVEAYSWPMGITACWFREVASGRPGVISKIGIDTAIDPKKGGGRLNGLADKRRTCTVREIAIDGEEYLLYEAPKPSVALVRGTTADKRSNITMEDEAMRGTVLSMAQATKAHPDPGTVIAQVRRVTASAANPRAVEIPGPLVDFVVTSPAAYHWQLGSAVYDPAFGSSMEPSSEARQAAIDPVQQVIARRVLVELVEVAKKKGSQVIVNLGIGIPALVSRLAVMERVSDYIVTVLESGQWGGVALSGLDFGVAINPFALSSSFFEKRDESTGSWLATSAAVKKLENSTNSDMFGSYFTRPKEPRSRLRVCSMTSLLARLSSTGTDSKNFLDLGANGYRNSKSDSNGVP